jgi:hypothetical protein
VPAGFRCGDFFEEQIHRNERGGDPFGAQSPAECDCQVSLALAGLAEQQQILLSGEEGERC